MIYDIVNTKDPYTIEAPTEQIAVAACIFLGSGYGVVSQDRVFEGPIPMLMPPGGFADWFKDEYAMTLDQFLTDHAAAVAECLESIILCDAQDREGVIEDAIDSSGGNAASYRVALDQRHDRVRTSPTDTGEHSLEVAKSIRAKIESRKPAEGQPDRKVTRGGV